MMPIQSNREDGHILKWDNAKGMLAVLVVLGHVAESALGRSPELKWLFLFLYLFHMPAFFFLSGVVSKKAVAARRYDRVVGFLLLHFLMKMIVFSVRFLLGERPPGFHVYWEDGIAWYAFAMAVFLLLSILLQDMKRSYILIGAILLACFAGYDDAVGDTLVLSRIIVFFPFFYCGLCLDGKRLNRFLQQKKVIILSAVLFAAVLLLVWRYSESLYWLRTLVTGRNPFSKLKRYRTWGGALRGLYYIWTFLLITAFLALIPVKNTFLSWIGKRSLPIYALQISLIRLLNFNGFRDRFMDWSIFPTKLIPCVLLTALVVLICSWGPFNRFFRAVMNVRRDEKAKEK